MVREKGENVLMAFLKPSAGPEMVIAGPAANQNTDYLLLRRIRLELMRHQFGGRNLGHIYIYRDSWPVAEQPATIPRSLVLGPCAFAWGGVEALPSSNCRIPRSVLCRPPSARTRALSRHCCFKRQVSKAGIFADLKRLRHHETPSRSTSTRPSSVAAVAKVCPQANPSARIGRNTDSRFLN